MFVVIFIFGSNTSLDSHSPLITTSFDSHSQSVDQDLGAQ
jgi:hypothetical protein